MDEKIDVAKLTNPLTPVEHRQKILKGLIAQIPGLGPILNEYLPNSRLIKLTNIVLQLKEDLEKLKTRIDEEYISRDDVSCLVEKSLKSMSETYDDFKLLALKSGLINSLINKDIPVDRKEFYINILNSLSPFHFKLLYLIYDTENYLAEAQTTLLLDNESSPANFLKKALPDITTDEVNIIIADLKNKGLIRDMAIHGLRTERGVNSLKGFKNEFGNGFTDFFKMKQN